MEGMKDGMGEAHFSYFDLYAVGIGTSKILYWYLSMNIIRGQRHNSNFVSGQK